MQCNGYYLVPWILVSTMATGCDRHYIKRSLTFDETITRIDVDTDSDVFVEPSSSNLTHVDVDVNCWGKPTNYDVSVVGKALRVTFNCPHDGSGRMTIRVPSTVVTSNLYSGGGDISGTLASDTCVAYADSGGIRMTFLAPPASLDLGADSGDVSIRIPSGAYSLSTKLDVGHQRIANLTVDPASPNLVRVDVHSGDISVIGY